MSNPLENNAYRVLGLDVTASPKNILKRYNEIVGRLKIDDYPDYSLDIDLPKNFRTEETVKAALKELQSPKDSIKEYFFWFQISNNNDERAQNCLLKGEVSKAIEIWKDLAKSKNSAAFFYKKNLAILYCLLLLKGDNPKYFNDSLSMWKELVNSKEFWGAFSKVYSAQNEQIASQENISSFQNIAIEEISDIYTGLSRINKNPKYIREFQKAFGSHGTQTEKTVLQPLYQEINDNIEDLRKVKISEVGGRDLDMDDESKWQSTIKEIDSIIEPIQRDLKKLRKNGLYGSAESKVVRDHAAVAIREKSVELYNYWSTRVEAEWMAKFGPREEAAWMLDLASKISGTESYKSVLKSDKAKLAKSIMADKDSLVSVEIRGFLSTKYAEFKPRFVEYEGIKIFYKDILDIAFSGIRTNYSTTYTFVIDSDDKRISLSFSNLDTWNKLVGLSSQFIIPLIVKRHIDQIFEKNEVVTIGDVEFSKRGYTGSTFWGGTNFVSWKDKVYVPQFGAGYVVLFRDKEGKGVRLATIQMSVPNAVILPVLVKACVNAAHLYKAKT